MNRFRIEECPGLKNWIEMEVAEAEIHIKVTPLRATFCSLELDLTSTCLEKEVRERDNAYQGSMI